VNSRLVIGKQIYDIQAIDDPMNLHEHIEIYLKSLTGEVVRDSGK
jgi:hypothetical protein